MTQNTFEVVFKGELIEGVAADRVKAGVAALFKVDVSKVERLFTGATVSIKKGVDEQTAKKYQAALKKAGAICYVVNRAAAATPPPPPPQETPAPVNRASFAVDEPAAPSSGRANFAVSDETPAQTENSATVDHAAAAPSAPQPVAVSEAEDAQPDGVGMQKTVLKRAPDGFGELAAASVDAPGAVLVEHQDVPPPDIDTSTMSFDESDSELVEQQPVEALQVDTSDLSMDEVGATLGNEEPFDELEVDISDLSMDEPGVILIEHKDEPEPQIDTSKLSME